MLGVVLVIAAVAVIVGVCLWYIAVLNRIRGVLGKIEETDSGIEVALTKRYDLLTKMVALCRKYAEREAGTLSGLVELRRGMDVNGRSLACRRMDEVSRQIAELAEAYPDLRSSANFKELQTAVRETEERLRAARRLYNGNVSVFNRLLATFPAGWVGGKLHLRPRAFFTAEEAEKADVEMAL